MSNALALAAVSAVLKDLLDNAMNDHEATTAVGSPVKVSVRPPDRVKLADGDPPQLNLFLFQVTPNQGWRNVGLPSRNGEGERTSRSEGPDDGYAVSQAGLTLKRQRGSWPGSPGRRPGT